MNASDFKNSKWVEAARDPRAYARVAEELPDWIRKVRNSELVARARRLKDYLLSAECTTGDIILVVAALLYLISPIDAVPDFIPFFGWLDDVAVAGLVLGYLDKKSAAHREAQVYDI